MATCVETSVDRRRLFWATQPDSCGSETRCGYACGVAGLSYADDDITIEAGDTRTILTTDWIRGLVINMLMTDGREPNTACGYRPNSQGGHWSQSYLQDGTSDVGTLLRTVAPNLTVNETLATVVAYAKSTLQRLVARGVAVDVEVTGAYAGSGTIQLNVIVYGQDQTITKVGLDGSRLKQSWVWT